MEKFLDSGLQKQISEFFLDLQQPVKVTLFVSKTQNCEYCSEIEQLLCEVVALSEKLDLVVYDIDDNADKARELHVDKVPGFVLLADENGKDVDLGIRYYGIPAGHEFASLINDILVISTRDSGLKPQTRDFLKNLIEPVSLMVFVTPSCPYCPQAVILAHRMALESPMVEAEMVEASEFPELSRKYGVSGVPHTTINQGAGVLIGAAPEDNLVEEIKKALKK